MPDYKTVWTSFVIRHKVLVSWTEDLTLVEQNFENLRSWRRVRKNSDFSYRGEEDLVEISKSVCRPTSSIGRDVPVDLWVKFDCRWLMLYSFICNFSLFQSSSKDQPTRRSALRRRTQNSASRTIQRNSWVIRLGCHFIKIIIIIIWSALPKIVFESVDVMWIELHLSD